MPPEAKKEEARSLMSYTSILGTAASTPSPDGLIPRTASHASSCIPALDVRSTLPDGFAYGKSTQVAPAATCCQALAPSTKPPGGGAEQHAEGMIFHPDGGRYRFSGENCR